MSGIIMSCEIVHKDTIFFLYIAIVERRTDLVFARIIKYCSQKELQIQEEFEDTKGAIRIRISKNIGYTFMIDIIACYINRSRWIIVESHQISWTFKKFLIEKFIDISFYHAKQNITPRLHSKTSHQDSTLSSTLCQR